MHECVSVRILAQNSKETKTKIIFKTKVSQMKTRSKVVTFQK